eukprot:137224-Pelagomonas_calceolata.AAC.10
MGQSVVWLDQGSAQSYSSSSCTHEFGPCNTILVRASAKNNQGARKGKKAILAKTKLYWPRQVTSTIIECVGAPRRFEGRKDAKKSKGG